MLLWQPWHSFLCGFRLYFWGWKSSELKLAKQPKLNRKAPNPDHEPRAVILPHHHQYDEHRRVVQGTTSAIAAATKRAIANPLQGVNSNKRKLEPLRDPSEFPPTPQASQIHEKDNWLIPGWYRRDLQIGPHQRKLEPPCAGRRRAGRRHRSRASPTARRRRGRRLWPQSAARRGGGRS